jgi:hypothetical protein
LINFIFSGIFWQGLIGEAIVTDYPRFPGEDSDDKRIMRAVQDCSGGVLYFPKGTYEIAEMLVVTNCCSFLLHKSAVLKAVRAMPFVIKIDAAASYPDVQEKDGHLVPSDDPDAEDWNLFFSGGYVDGAGLAFLLIGLARKLKVSNYLLLLVSPLFSVAGLLLKDTGTGILFPDLLLGLLWKTQEHAYFTLFHWFVFPVCGMISGKWIKRCKDKTSMYKKLIPITIPVMIITEGGAILLKNSLLDSFTEYFYMT